MVMKLEIFNFRCIKELTLEFGQEGSHLINGDNGTGKSTVCQAIEWCLYGGGTNIKHHKEIERTGDPRVILTMQSLKVDRSKNPERLSVTINGEEETQSGQSLINKLFGPKNLWIACSYLPQDSLHLLVDGTDSDKSKLIYDLTFGDQEGGNLCLTDTPDFYISKIKEKIKQSNEDLKAKEVLIQYISNELESLNCKDIESGEERIDELRELVERTRELREQTKTDLMQAKVHSGSRQTLLKQIEETHQDLVKLAHENSEIKDMSDLDITDLCNRMVYQKQEIDSKIEVNMSIQKLNQELYSLNIPEDVEGLLQVESTELEQWVIANYSNLDKIGATNILLRDLRIKITALVKIKEDNDRYQKELREIAEFNLAIDNKINKLELDKQTRQLYEYKQKQWDKYQLALKDLVVAPKTSKVKLEEEKAKIATLLSDYICPECGIGLVVSKGKLSKGSIHADEREKLETKLIEVNKEIEEWSKHEVSVALIEAAKVDPIDIVPPSNTVESIVEMIKELKSQKKGAPNKPARSDVPDVVVDILTKLNDLKVESRFSEYTLENLQGYFKNKSRFLLVQEKLRVACEQKCNIPMSSLLAKYKDLNIKITKYKSFLTQRKKNNENLNKLELNLSIIPEVSTDKMDQMESKIVELDQRIERSEQIFRYMQTKSRLDAEKQAREDLLVSLDNLSTALKLVENLMYESMSEVCQAVQNQTNLILRDIFSEDENQMVVSINTIKVTKTALKKDMEGAKLAINLTLVYKDVTYTNLNRLSGGERSILSLALLIGMSQTSGSPFIVLDEAFNSISVEKRDKCAEVIERYVSDKVILTILHGADLDSFDSVISV